MILRPPSSFVSSFIVAGVVAVTVVTATDQLCTLECENFSACIMGDADFSNHATASGDQLDFHSSTNIDGMHCQCEDEWTGVKCEVPFETCSSSDGNPAHICYNGGECIDGLLDTYGNEHHFCDCDEAYDQNGLKYVGKWCEELEANHCSTLLPGTTDQYMFCLNGGQCNDQYPQFGEPCLCKDGYTGESCEYKKETVPDCTASCQNGGYCKLGEPSDEERANMNYVWYEDGNYDGDESPLLTGQYCVCPLEWDGVRCEVPKVSCGEYFCFSGGTCESQVINQEIVYHCDCTSTFSTEKSYAGKFCEYQASTYCTKDTSMNGQLFCVNGGQCNMANPYLGCDCDPGYTGFSCEYTEDVDGEPAVNNGGAPPVNGGAPPVNNGAGPTDNTDLDDLSLEDQPPEPVLNQGMDTPPVCDLACDNDGICRNGIKETEYDDILQNTNYMDENHVDFMHCVCPLGYTGVKCETVVQTCPDGEHICLHGSTCVKEGEDSKCDCDTAIDTLNLTDEDTFEGNHCEHPVNDICTIDQPAPGQPLSFCVNGGTCLDSVQASEGHAGCSCPPGFVGPHCELRESDDDDEDSLEDEYEDLQDPIDDIDEPSTTSNRDGLKIATLFFSVLAVILVTCFWCVQCTKSRRRKKHHRDINKSMSWRHSGADGYRDHSPNGTSINLAPKQDDNYEPTRSSSPPPAEDANLMRNSQTATASGGSASSSRTSSSASVTDEQYMAAMHSANTDPFTTQLSPTKKLLDADENGMKQQQQQPQPVPKSSSSSSGPQVYIGPPRDEDGHVLHSVDII